MEIEKQMPVNYNDVISRGFKRENHSDKVFFDENGYEWFTVTKKLTKRIYIDWDCETHFLQLIRWNPKDGTIYGRIYLTGELDELDRVIRFFTCDTPDKIDAL